MEHGPVLGGVDLVAPEHGLDVLFQVRLVGEVQEQMEGLVREAVLGIVQVEPRPFADHPLPAIRRPGEQLPQVQVLHFLVVRSQGLPGGTLGQRRTVHDGLPGLASGSPHPPPRVKREPAPARRAEQAPRPALKRNAERGLRGQAGIQEASGTSSARSRRPGHARSARRAATPRAFREGLRPPRTLACAGAQALPELWPGRRGGACCYPRPSPQIPAVPVLLFVSFYRISAPMPAWVFWHGARQVGPEVPRWILPITSPPEA